MSQRKIDYDRGVIIKIHQTSGMDVFMYVDTPGVFLNAFGTEIDPSIAKEAGYDVDRLLREKVKRERMAQAAKLIEQELALEEKEGVREVVAERQGFKVIDLGLGRHYVEDPEGNQLTAQPLPLEQAKLLLSKLTPDKEPKVETPKAKAKAKVETPATAAA